MFGQFQSIQLIRVSFLLVYWACSAILWREKICISSHYSQAIAQFGMNFCQKRVESTCINSQWIIKSRKLALWPKKTTREVTKKKGFIDEKLKNSKNIYREREREKIIINTSHIHQTIFLQYSTFFTPDTGWALPLTIRKNLKAIFSIQNTAWNDQCKS